MRKARYNGVGDEVMITFIWAEDEQHKIGLDGHLPWYIPEDLKHFKTLTINHPIIMGRKTFNSLPRILPQRRHIVLSQNQVFKEEYEHNPQVIVVSSVNSLNKWINAHQTEQLYVIGGVSVFEALKDRVGCLEKTAIAATFPADTVMPDLNYDDFELIKKVHHQANNKCQYSYDFLTYLRKKD